MTETQNAEPSVGALALRTIAIMIFIVAAAVAANAPDSIGLTALN